MTQQTFCDFDEFAAAVREVDCTMMVQNAEIHEWNLQIAEAGKVEVQFGKLGSGNILQGTSWKDGVLIYLPETPGARCAANGETLLPGAFMVLEPHAPFDLSSSGRHNWYTLFLPREKFSGSHWDQPNSYATQPNQALAKRFRSLLSEVLKASKESESFSCSVAGKSAERALCSVASQVLAVPGTHKYSRSTTRKEHATLIRSARKYLEASPGDELRVAEMARTLGVSERMLRQLFQEYFSASPKQFIETYTIRRIRDALLASDPDEQTVADILMSYGIFELGRFAGRYRQAYGELPSATLWRAHPSKNPGP